MTTVIGLLICTIGLIPIVLAFSVSKIYNESKLAQGLSIYMILITTWQFYVGILYFEQIWNEEITLFLFRLFRMGPTFSIPVIFYLVCTIVEGQPRMGKENRLQKFLFNKKILYLLVSWSLFIYVINWTKLGVVGLTITNAGPDSISFYYPQYGPLGWLFIVHVSSFILYLIIVFAVSRKIFNPDMRNFLKRFSIYLIFLFVFGLLNFHPTTGMVTSSIGVVMFSTLIMFEFVKLNNNIKQNYYQLMERQKKLDYTGSLTASLIHEVENTNQIIKGFSKMLKGSESMTERDSSALNMILKSSEHLGDLASNYKEYMETSKMELKLDDLGSIIENAIDYSQEMMNEYGVEVEYNNDYVPLKAFVNRTYLEQVFINLIKNSVEAIPEDKEDRKIIIRTKVVDNSILIHFTDTGKGIPFGNWESVFDPFMSFKGRGMGLGLPFVKKVIIEHLGKVDIVESSSKGTRFQIELPQNGIMNIDH